MTRILVVEDEPSISDPLAYLLQREGYEVTVVDDGLEAVAEFNRNGADLVLLDLMLPGQPGTDVIRQIRSEERRVGKGCSTRIRTYDENRRGIWSKCQYVV